MCFQIFLLSIPLSSASARRHADVPNSLSSLLFSLLVKSVCVEDGSHLRLMGKHNGGVEDKVRRKKGRGKEVERKFFTLYCFFVLIWTEEKKKKKGRVVVTEGESIANIATVNVFWWHFGGALLRG